ncbi:MAG: FliM/FliN family flagellar motor switch protein [SAR324 cluster bacterium]|nr:FliM/FliN family flagellar motor switch protein [SAR324 cluster bacterium]
MPSEPSPKALSRLLDQVIDKARKDPRGAASAPQGRKRSKAVPAPPEAETYDLAQHNRIIRGRMPGLEAVHDRFARIFAQTLTQHMRRSIGMLRRATEMVSMKDYLHTLQEPYSITRFSLPPLHGVAVFALEQRLGRALIDLRLGGSGHVDSRDARKGFTAIEAKMVEKVVNSGFEDLTRAWKPISPLTATRFERTETNAKSAAVVPESEVMVVTTFDVEVNRVPMALSIGIPYYMLDPIGSRLDTTYQIADAEENQVNVGRLTQNLLGSSLTVQVPLGHARVSLRHFLKLKVGDRILLDQEHDQPLPVLVNGKLKFRGVQGAYKGKIAVQISDVQEPPKRFLDATDSEAAK